MLHVIDLNYTSSKSDGGMPLDRKLQLINIPFFLFMLGNLTLNDSCELTEQCIQPFSVCLDGKCQCLNGFSAFDTDGCLKGLCSL